MKVINTTIHKYLNEEGVFNIPVYQRNYEWKKIQCEKLFYDIENILNNDGEINHFLGTIVSVEQTNNRKIDEKIIIDGQQRIISLMLLIKAIHDILDDKNTKKILMEDYLINRNYSKETGYYYKLKPIENDRKSYNNLLENEGYFDNSNIFENYKKFYDLVKTSNYNPEKILQTLRYIDIVVISLDSEKKSENPQLIFESLNSTGLSLTASDLVRNYLLMSQSYKKQVEFHQKYWLTIEKNLNNSEITKFIRDFLTMKTGNITKEKDVYEYFKRYMNNEQEITEEMILKELSDYAKFYNWIINANSENESLNSKLYELHIFENTTAYPFLLKLFAFFKIEKKIGIDEFIRVLDFILSYIFRRIICKIPSNALNILFSSIVINIEKYEGKNIYEQIVNFIMSKTGSAKFPKNDEFKMQFLKYEIYKKKKICKYILGLLEKQGQKEIVIIDDMSLEHIMPKTLSNEWKLDLGSKYNQIHSQYVNTIGNITITGYNSEMSNKEFDIKKDSYKNSNIKINRDLSKYVKWGETEILDRANNIFEKIKKRYYQPDYKESQTNKLEISKKYLLSDLINVKGSKPSKLVVYNKKFSVSSWRELYKILCGEFYKIDEKIFENLLFHKRLKVWMSRDKNKLRDGFEILDSGIYVELQANANTILSLSATLIEEFEMEEDIWIVLSKV